MKEYVLKEKIKPDSFNLIVGIHKTKNYFYQLKRYREKIYKFGDIYEIYHYQKPVRSGYQKSEFKIRNKTNDDEKIDNRKKVVTRIRNNVRRLVLANFDENSKFFTATFEKNIKDMDYANREFKKFIQRLRYQCGDFKYLAVVEFQKRGAIHYHMISDFGYIEQKKLEEIWDNGFVWIRNLLKANNGKPVDNVGAYIVKYMDKDMIDERLMGKKAYFTSRNLKRPEIIYENLNLWDCFVKYGFDGDHMIFSNKFFSKENGQVSYYEFNKRRDNINN